MRTSTPRILAALFTALLAAGAAGATEEVVVFRNVGLVTMTDETVVRDRAVVIRGSRIAEIVPSADLEVPEGATVIDGHGAYLMPGLADMHTHLNDVYFTHPFFDLFLANGVTTIRDLAQGSPPSVLAYRREIESGARLGPNLLVANTYWGTETDVVGRFRAQQPLGYDCAKLNSYLSRDDFTAIMEIAKERNVYTLGHIPYALGLDGILAGGMNEVSHVNELLLSEMSGLDHDQRLDPGAWEDQLIAKVVEGLRPYRGMSADEIERAARGPVRDLMERLRGKDLAFSTTLICDKDIVDKLFDREKLAAAAHASYVSPRFWVDIESGADKHMKMLPGDEWAFSALYELERVVLREMKRSGVRLVLGTDVGPTYLSLVPGFSVHDELAILVESGFTPYEALTTCTRTAAEVASRMTGRHDFGTIEPGKRADFVLVGSNPLEDLSTARSPLGVMVAGHWLPPETLAALLAVETENAGDAFAEAYRGGGIEAALSAYRKVKESNFFNAGYCSSGMLNDAAYELLGEGKVEEAVRLLELNAAEYPEDPNVYDSLAEGYWKRGDRESAVMFYRKSLAMDPCNTNAAEMLRSLGAM